MTDAQQQYSLLPDHIQGGAAHYIQEGVRPGHFLTAVICNDLREAFARADDINTARMADIVRFFYNEAPSECWGSKAKMDQWLERFRKQKETDDEDR